jgi:hypothetical protein
VISILKQGKDPTLSSSHKPISLLDNVGELFGKMLLSWVLTEINERGLLRDEQFGFRPRLSRTLQLACLVERVNRNLDERRLTGAVFLDVAKAFDTVWVEGLLYKLTVLKFPSYLVKTISSYLQYRMFQGLSEVSHGQPKRTDVQQASRGHPYKAAKSTHVAVPTARLN